MSNRLFYDENEHVAEYSAKWESIYADKEFNAEMLESIRADLIRDGYKVVHVVTGNSMAKPEPVKKKRGRKKKGKHNDWYEL